MATEEESLSLHVDIGGVIGNSGDFVGEKNCGWIKMLANAVSNYAAKPLYFLFSHGSDENGGFFSFSQENFERVLPE